MLEAVSDEDDTLLEKYLEGQGDYPDGDSWSCFGGACLKVSIIPVLCGSSFKNKGVQMLLDAVVNYLPSPLDLNEGIVEGHHINLTDKCSAKLPTKRSSPRWPSRS